jgi:hypothetical protein
MLASIAVVGNGIGVLCVRVTLLIKTGERLLTISPVSSDKRLPKL